jgi:TRAF3-interacting protein 1
VVAQK